MLFREMMAFGEHRPSRSPPTYLPRRVEPWAGLVAVGIARAVLRKVFLICNVALPEAVQGIIESAQSAMDTTLLIMHLVDSGRGRALAMGTILNDCEIELKRTAHIPLDMDFPTVQGSFARMNMHAALHARAKRAGLSIEASKDNKQGQGLLPGAFHKSERRRGRRHHGLYGSTAENMRPTWRHALPVWEGGVRSELRAFSLLLPQLPGPARETSKQLERHSQDVE